MATNLDYELLDAHALMMQGLDEEALEYLSRLAQDAEEYVDRNCPTTEDLQWFSFGDIFERLLYRRVENDPRELRDVGEPYDALYESLAIACERVGEHGQAIEAMKQAVRWNPIRCSYRLELAELFWASGDMREAMALAFSVFERASEAHDLAYAFVMFAEWFVLSGDERSAAAALFAARRLNVKDSRVEAALVQAAQTAHDPDLVSEDEVEALLGAQGLPSGANAEVAVCLLMCAKDAAAAGDRALQTTWTVRARDLVGQKAAIALIQLIQEADAEGSADGRA